MSMSMCMGSLDSVRAIINTILQNKKSIDYIFMFVYCTCWFIYLYYICVCLYCTCMYVDEHATIFPEYQDKLLSERICVCARLSLSMRTRVHVSLYEHTCYHITRLPTIHKMYVCRLSFSQCETLFHRHPSGVP